MNLEDIDLPLTRSARRCLRMAQVIAWHQGNDADVELLLLCIVLHPEERSRARLCVRSLGAVFDFSDNGTAVVERARAYLDLDGYAAGLSPSVQAVVQRLPYWAQRTGDKGIDTAHLLLACLESAHSDSANTVEFAKARVNIRDVIRAAMAERHFVTPSDRQQHGGAPILSDARPHRPKPVQFQEQPPDVPLLKVRNFRWRGWTAGSEHVNSFVMTRMIRLQVWMIAALQVMNIGAWAAVAYASVMIDAWLALAIVPLVLTAKNSPLAVRIAADGGLVALSIWGHLPWWLAAVFVVYHGIDYVESKIAILVVKADTADPAVTIADLRSDMKANLRTAMFRRILT